MVVVLVIDVAAGGVDRGKRDDIDEEDDQESYFRYMEENPTAGLINDDDDNIEYDEDGNAIIPEKKVSDTLHVWLHVGDELCETRCIDKILWLRVRD